ncbi:MAG TPA: protein kinase, partial [Candidatus Acidoferrales bacterium]|nr:protein kinase [Candidatus Acidoferrales bacterium]
YMSPEQARGKAVDRRADIWSFGVVLYEMLAGAQAFGGETISDTLAAVIKEEPDWTRLPASTPGAIRRILRRSTEKDAKRRLQAIGEARIAIEDYLAHPGEEAAASTVAGAPVTAVPEPAWPRVRRGGPWAGMALFAVLAAIGFGRLWMHGAGTGPGVALRLNSDIGAEGALYTELGSSEVFSPDGTRIVYVVNAADGKQQLYVRELGQLQAVALGDTNSARDPFFSPDGEWIGFFASGKMKKVSVHGGAAVTLCDAANSRGGSWSEDGTIVFAASNREGLSRISAAGGTAEGLTKLDVSANEVSHRWPQVLPGGKAVLFTAATNFNTFEDSTLQVQVLSSGAKKTVYRGAMYGRYLPSGHLVFVHQGTLFAMPFDLKRLEPAGEAVPAVEQVLSSPDYGGAQFSFSETGSLVYVHGKSGGTLVSVQWMGQDGKLQPLRKTPADIYEPAFSPDGKRLALEIHDAARSDIWIYDWQRDTLTRLTFEGESNYSPVWTADGQRIAYTVSDKAGRHSIYWKRADGAGDAQRLTESKGSQYPASWSPDGKVLALFAADPNSPTNWDIYTLTMQGDEKTGWKPGEPKLFLGTPAIEVRPVFSPDGRWLAYMSNESGDMEVYVRPFPGPGGKWQISSGGGEDPVWSRTSKQLFYETPKQQIMFVGYSAAADSFQVGKPALWSEGQFTSRGLAINFDLHPDGKRFAVLKSPAGEPEQQFNKIVFVSNFFDELRQKVPPKK